MFFDFSDFLIGHTWDGDFAGICNCRMAAYIVQNGHCYVMGTELKPYHRELHHRLPVEYGGPDTPENLVMLNITVHHLVHARHPDEIASLLRILNPARDQLHRINQLRLEAKRLAIDRRCVCLNGADERRPANLICVS
jgi:hypothetical protein